MSASLRFINITTADGLERRFAVGLWWQLRHAGPAPKKTLRLNARKIADEFRDEEYNVVLLREQQFGLGRTKEAELPEKVHSLADALRMRREQDAFVAVFNLEPDLWWVVAISKGIIAAEGDTWHESREAAEKAAHSHQQMVSVEFKVFETPEESLEFLLPLLAPERILEELYPNPDRQRQMLVRLGKVAALIAAGAAAWFGWNWYQGREASRLLESQMETRARYEAELRANPERVFKMHWNQAPQVADAGGQCVEAITSQPLADLGWTLDELICAPGSGVTVYRRHNAGASFTELPERVKLITSQRTSEHVPLLKLPVRTAVPHDALPARSEMTAEFYEFTQLMKLNLENLSWQPPEQVTRDEIQLVAPWQAGNFTVTAIPHSAVSSGAVFRALSYPGLIIKSIVYNARTKTWTIQGVSYARTS